MVMNPRQEISLLKTQNAALEVKNAALEERIKEIEARLEPKPPERAPAVPKWAGSGGDPITGTGVGSSYSGAPSVVPTGDGVSWIKERRPDGAWKDPFGMWRDAANQVIPHQIAGIVERRPVGPERDPRHEDAVRTLDNMIERDAARAEAVKLLDRLQT
jgi:hypothetical protein